MRERMEMKAVLVLALATLAAGSRGYGGGSSSIGGARYGVGVTYGSNNYVPVDVTFNSEYHFSWKHDGGQAYDFEGAQYYCKSLGYGWRGISFETLEEDAAADNVLYHYGLDFIWTSGYKQGYDWVWASGKTLNVQDWSKSGGDYKPQPDNREGNENCLAVLNNFYKDGIKWHDVACHHKKPIICERTISSRSDGITSGGSGYGSGGVTHVLGSSGSGYGSGGVTRVHGGSGSGYGSGGVTHVLGSSGSGYGSGGVTHVLGSSGSGYGRGGVTRVLGGSGSGYGSGGVTHIVGSSGYGGRGGSVGSGYGGGRGRVSGSRGSGYGH